MNRLPVILNGVRLDEGETNGVKDPLLETRDPSLRKTPLWLRLASLRMTGHMRDSN